MTSKRGAQPIYTDVALETALSLRRLFHLLMRQTEGFLGSVLRLIGLALPCPDHPTLSRQFAWKPTSGYYNQGHVENAFWRYQRTFGSVLRAKRDESQAREASLGCKLLNRTWELGRSQSYPAR